MEQIKRDNAEITHYQVSEDVSFSPALLFDPIDVARREIPDLPIEIEENSVETIDFDVETSGQPTHSIESQVEPSEPSMTESKAMTEATETKRSPSEDSMTTDHFSSLLQEIHAQLIELASPILSQLQSDSLLPSSLTLSSLSPERIAYFSLHLAIES